MEVHAHTHTPRKKWTHYFWEFLMLFLAVFCGFLAENQREHYIENQREKQYIKSMVDDLTQDIVLADRQVLFQTKFTIQMDSLIEMLGSKLYPVNNTNQLYYFGRIAARSVRFFNNDRTIEQMKNSGAFRLIRNQEASKKIMIYYRQVDFIKFLEKREDDEQETYKKLAAKVFDPIVFKNMVSEGDIHRIETSPPLLSYNSSLLKELAGAVQYMNGSRNGCIMQKQGLRKIAADLISFLKNEYHLSEGTPLDK